MGTLLIVIPSRGRPDRLQTMLQSLRETAETFPTIQVCIDRDDPQFPEYSLLCARENGVDFIVQPRHSPAQVFNEVFPKDRQHDYFFGGSDDLLFHTQGWDRMLINAIGGTGISYGNDLHQASRLPTSPVISSDIVHALGWFVLPGLNHLYGDNVFRDLGMGMNRLFYVPEVVIEHQHPDAGKGERDATWQWTNSPENYRHDEAVYNDWRRGQRVKDIQQLRKLLTLTESSALGSCKT